MDHRSGDGWSSGWFIIFHHYEAFQCRILKYLMRRLLQRWTESSVILTSKEELVWRNKKPRSRTVSFASSRLLTWSTNTCGSLEPTILSRSMPTCSPSVFEMTIFRNSTQNGTEFLLSMTKIPLDDILEECTNWKYQCLRISRPWSTEQDWRNKNFGARNGNYDENAVAPWLRIREQKQRVQRILGDCWQWELNGQCSRRDNCTFRHDIKKRGKTTQPNTSPNSFHAAEWAKSIETPKSQGKKSQLLNVSMVSQGLPQRNLQQLVLWKVAPSRMHVLQDQESLSVWRKSSYAPVRLMNSRLKGPKRMTTSAVAMLMKNDWHDSVREPVID